MSFLLTFFYIYRFVAFDSINVIVYVYKCVCIYVHMYHFFELRHICLCS